MNKIYTFCTAIIGLTQCFGEVPSLKNLSSKAFIKAYDGSPEHREALRSVEPNKYDFSNASIEDKDFSGEDLQGANFSNCKLINVNFDNANLINANFERITTKNVTFEGAILWKGFIYSSELSDEAKIRLYDQLTKNFLELKKNKTLTSEETKNFFSSKKVLNRLVFATHPLKLNGVSLNGLNLSGINLENSTLQDVDLSATNLDMANLNGSKLINVNLENAILIGISLKKAGFYNTCIKNTQLTRDVKFSFNNIGYGDSTILNLFRLLIIFKNSHIDQKNYLLISNLASKDETIVLTNNLLKCFASRLSNLILDKFTRSDYKLNLDGIDLENFNLSGCNFTKFSLVNSNLAHTNLSKANLEGVDLTGANLVSTNLVGTNLKGTQLGGVKLTSDYSLPYEFDDQKLLDSYKFLSPAIKVIVKHILVCKELIKEGKEPSTELN